MVECADLTFVGARCFCLRVASARSTCCPAAGLAQRCFVQYGRAPDLALQPSLIVNSQFCSILPGGTATGPHPIRPGPGAARQEPATSSGARPPGRAAARRKRKLIRRQTKVQTVGPLARNRWFESISLQRGVSSEPCNGCGAGDFPRPQDKNNGSFSRSRAPTSMAGVISAPMTTPDAPTAGSAISARLNNAVPLVQSHYSTFIPTKDCSAPVPRIGTLVLAGFAAWTSPFASGRQVLTFPTRA